MADCIPDPRLTSSTLVPDSPPSLRRAARETAASIHASRTLHELGPTQRTLHAAPTQARVCDGHASVNACSRHWPGHTTTSQGLHGSYHLPRLITLACCWPLPRDPNALTAMGKQEPVYRATARDPPLHAAATHVPYLKPPIRPSLASHRLLEHAASIRQHTATEVYLLRAGAVYPR
jgi:hypothetical protein